MGETRAIANQMSSWSPPTFDLNPWKFMWQLPELWGISGEFHSRDPLPPGKNSRSPQPLRNLLLRDLLLRFWAATTPAIAPTITVPSLSLAARYEAWQTDSHPPSFHPSILPVMREMLPSMTNRLLGPESHKCHGVNTCGFNNDSTVDISSNSVPKTIVVIVCQSITVLLGFFCIL